MQCKRQYFLNDGKCQTCSDKNCGICSHELGVCETCKEGFGKIAEDKTKPASVKCVDCNHTDPNTFWNKFTKTCIPKQAHQYVIFGYGSTVLPEKNKKTLTSNGIILPNSTQISDYVLVGSLSIKIIDEVKGGLSFSITDGDDESKEYVLQKFNGTQEKDKHLTIYFAVSKKRLEAFGLAKYEKAFFRITNYIGCIDKKVKFLNFDFNILMAPEKDSDSAP